MPHYLISKTYTVDLAVEATTAEAAFAIASDAVLEVRVGNNSPRVLASSCKFTGFSTPHNAAMTQEKVMAWTQDKVVEAAKAQALTPYHKTRGPESGSVSRKSRVTSHEALQSIANLT